MKRFLSILLAMVLCLSVFAMPVFAEDEEYEEEDVEYYSQDFQLRNSTGYEIVALYISPTEEESWSDNCLSVSFEDDVIINVTFDEIATGGYEWDLMAEDVEGDSMYFYGLALSEIYAIDLTYGEEGPLAITYTEAFE